MRICSNCGSDKTYIKDSKGKYPRPEWAWHNEKLYCYKCSFKLFLNPKYNKRTLYYKNKKHHFPFDIRTGICQLCKKKSITARHHLEYHDDDVLKDTIEVCRSCHNKEGRRLGQYKIRVRNKKGQFI